MSGPTLSANGAPSSQPRAKPWVHGPTTDKGLKARPSPCKNRPDRLGFVIKLCLENLWPYIVTARLVCPVDP